MSNAVKKDNSVDELVEGMIASPPTTPRSRLTALKAFVVKLMVASVGDCRAVLSDGGVIMIIPIFRFSILSLILLGDYYTARYPFIESSQTVSGDGEVSNRSGWRMGTSRQARTTQPLHSCRRDS